MKRMRALACALALAASVTPAVAGDLLFRKEQGPLILENFDGRPFWELQAYCAGVHGASANWFARKGETDKVQGYERAGVEALNDAVRQLQRDRKVSADAATKLVEPVVQMGGRRAAEALRISGTVNDGQWNYWRSFCADAKAAYVRAAR